MCWPRIYVVHVMQKRDCYKQHYKRKHYKSAPGHSIVRQHIYVTWIFALSANKHLCISLTFTQAHGRDNVHCILLLRSVFVGACVHLPVKSGIFWNPTSLFVFTVICMTYVVAKRLRMEDVLPVHKVRPKLEQCYSQRHLPANSVTANDL